MAVVRQADAAARQHATARTPIERARSVCTFRGGLYIFVSMLQGRELKGEAAPSQAARALRPRAMAEAQRRRLRPASQWANPVRGIVRKKLSGSATWTDENNEKQDSNSSLCCLR